MSFFVNWHILDIFFLLLGCYFVIKGAFNGFVGEALSFGSMILSAYAGFRHSDALGSLLGRAAGLNREVAQVLAVVMVWLIVTIVFAVLRRILKKIINFASLGGIDRMLGILIGVLKTLIVVFAVLVGGLLLKPVVRPTWMSRSDVLVFAGRKWPEVRRLLINIGALPKRTELPEGTLEQILRPYRRGNGTIPGSGTGKGRPRGNTVYNKKEKGIARS